jgi:hypothetical protein
MMTTRTVPAAQLHIGDLVLPATGPARRITLHRLQGTRPLLSWPMPDSRGSRHSLPAGQEVIVLAGPGGDERTTGGRHRNHHPMRKPCSRCSNASSAPIPIPT